MTTRPADSQRLARFKREWNELLAHGIGLKNALGAVAALLGAILTLIVALLEWGNEFILALIAIALQFGAALLFAQGRTAPYQFKPEKYAGNSLALLGMLARRASTSEHATQEVIERVDPDPVLVLATLRAVNVELSYIQELALMASDDWLRVLELPVQYGQDPSPRPNSSNDQLEQR